jgi:hypothetical protein
MTPALRKMLRGVIGALLVAMPLVLARARSLGMAA